MVVGPARPSLRGATCGGRALRLRRAPARCNALQPRETRGPAIPCAPLQHPSDLCSLFSQASLRCSQLPRTTRPSARAANHRSEAAFETHFLRVLLVTSSPSASLLQASSTTVSRTTSRRHLATTWRLQRPCARPCTSRLPSPLPCWSLKMSPRPSPCSLATKDVKKDMNPTRVLQP